MRSFNDWSRSTPVTLTVFKPPGLEPLHILPQTGVPLRGYYTATRTHVLRRKMVGNMKTFSGWRVDHYVI